jgi:6-pyruvoyltetrahydropterin/6-carboxytetrahydropterin synthase
MITYLTRIVHFSAAHRYYRPEWSDSRNSEVFGACANPYGHGHNYALEVTVAATPDPVTGFSIDLGELDSILQTHVRQPLDHQHLNHSVTDFRDGGLIPTTENVVIWIWKQLEPKLTTARLVRLRLREDAELFVDYFGEPQGGAVREREWFT